ncbi:hypothetical protein GOODEAATRI_032920 [Goodea atripinnis]|uniref:NADH dehydrogenase subunit 2 n=1 Tax=Goodea atripinnis TaxID=208336 RepID=A0ABV0MMP2_9TELE
MIAFLALKAGNAPSWNWPVVIQLASISLTQTTSPVPKMLASLACITVFRFEASSSIATPQHSPASTTPSIGLH